MSNADLIASQQYLHSYAPSTTSTTSIDGTNHSHGLQPPTTQRHRFASSPHVTTQAASQYFQQQSTSNRSLVGKDPPKRAAAYTSPAQLQGQQHQSQGHHYNHNVNLSVPNGAPSMKYSINNNGSATSQFPIMSQPMNNGTTVPSKLRVGFSKTVLL